MNRHEQLLYRSWKSQFKTHYLREVCWAILRSTIMTRNVKTVLEFGCGLSTLLFDNLGLKVTSFETDVKYSNFIKSRCSNNITLETWSNSGDPLISDYDLSLVDGILPREPQIKVATKHSNIIAIDDFLGKWGTLYSPLLANFNRIDMRTAKLAVFERKN